MKDKGLKVHSEISTTLQEHDVIGDPARLMQILSNFAWNACKVSLRGGFCFSCVWGVRICLMQILSNFACNACNGKQTLKPLTCNACKVNKL